MNDAVPNAGVSKVKHKMSGIFRVTIQLFLIIIIIIITIIIIIIY